MFGLALKAAKYGMLYQGAKSWFGGSDTPKASGSTAPSQEEGGFFTSIKNMLTSFMDFIKDLSDWENGKISFFQFGAKLVGKLLGWDDKTAGAAPQTDKIAPETKPSAAPGTTSAPAADATKPVPPEQTKTIGPDATAKTIGAETAPISSPETTPTIAPPPAMSTSEKAMIGATIGATTLETAKGVSLIAGQGLKGLAKRIPVLGGALTLGFSVAAAVPALANGEYSKAGAELTTGVAEALVNTTGAGLIGGGDMVREGMRAGVIATLGEGAAPEKSNLRELYNLATSGPATAKPVEPLTAKVKEPEVQGYRHQMDFMPM